MNHLSPALSAATGPGDAPTLGARSGQLAGDATPVRAWVVRREKRFNNMGVAFTAETPVAPLADLAADWPAMEVETFDNGHRTWGADWGDGSTLDLPSYVSIQEPRFTIRLLPAFLASADQVACWDSLRCDERWVDEPWSPWAIACPALATCPDGAEVMGWIVNFMGTKPRKQERQELKRELLAWMEGDGAYPVRARWMLKPYDPYAGKRAW